MIRNAIEVYSKQAIGLIDRAGILPVRINCSGLFTSSYSSSAVWHARVHSMNGPAKANNSIKVHYGTCLYPVTRHSSSSSSSSAVSSSSSVISDSSSSSSAGSNVISLPEAPDQLVLNKQTFLISAPTTSAGYLLFTSSVFLVLADYLYCWLDTSGIGINIELSMQLSTVQTSQSAQLSPLMLSRQSKPTPQNF